RLALFHFVVSKVFSSDQAAALLNGRGEFARHGTVIELVRIGGDALQRLGQFRLTKDFARFVVIPIALKDAARFWEAGQILVISEISGILPSQGKTLTGQLDCRSDNLLQRELAKFLLRVRHTRN